MGSGFVVAVLIGAGIAIQVGVLGRSVTDTNPLAVSFALQISGVLAATAWATSRGVWVDVVSIGRNWWWIPLGVGGWVLVAALGFASSRIGVAPTLAISVAVQLLTALVIDTTTGSGQLGPRPLLGAAMVLGGAVLVSTAA